MKHIDALSIDPEVQLRTLDALNEARRHEAELEACGLDHASCREFLERRKTVAHMASPA